MHDSNSKQDPTFDPMSEYGSRAYCAAVLGRSQSWFLTNRAKLEVEGFPKPCKIVGLTLKADVAAWISKRRRYADVTANDLPPPKAESKGRLDLL